jgi:ABC-2 type transport system ATP-binding protein
MIEVKNLVRKYGEFAAVDDVSFEIANGEVVGLLGHNGAGKTTIMKMLTGFLEPSFGSVKIDGLDVQSSPTKLQSEMGYLPESLPIYPELTVVAYLEYAARLRDVDPRVCVRKAIESTGLDEKALDLVSTLSRGYKQRVGVAQAILHEPKFLVLDEPTNGLDPNQIQQMRDLIRSLSEVATVILSTHIMQEVSAVCDRAIILNSGKLALDERLASLETAGSIRLRTSEGADVRSCLSHLDVIEGMESSVDGTWSLTLSGVADESAPLIAKALVDSGHPIIELTLESRDLESVFREISEQQITTGRAS